MPAITLSTVVYENGVAERVALYSVRNVTTGDTLDVSADFSAPKQAIFMATTTAAKGLGTISGTIVTIPTASVANDAGYLLVYGSSA